ncbi:hypothetical protein [Pseudothioclava nitratireducens]|jgi:hypothetical protein|uniref:hypothetical protein n=1 Tax=Pseudothioclava nitratireducens TaxID=1928646 RepID=UPI0023DB8624|nr:hypothetical protein [Defluviimonas nitratireducens]MDF1619412.1 hypothetical protein [Defluviimonas nitratireducens]
MTRSLSEIDRETRKILAIDRERMPDHVAGLLARRALSRVVHDLNRVTLTQSGPIRDRAERALQRMGFL